MKPPATDWNAIRKLMNAAIDACEAVDRLGIGDDERSAVAWRTGETEVSVHDFFVSAWTYPESVELDLVRMRHELDADAPYVDTPARTLVQVARACAQLVGARAVMRRKAANGRSMADVAGNLGAWYARHYAPRLTSGIRAARKRKS
jgi:hypothetical protein